MFGQDLDSLRKIYFKDFKETFKNESFEIGDMIIKQDSGKSYFEIDIVPQTKKVYAIKQTFKYEDGWGYKNNSILNIIKVGKKGTSRTFSGMEPNPFISYTCSVGDTIVIPIYWDSHIIANKFSSGNNQEYNIWGKIDLQTKIWKQEERQLDWDITNNVDELKVIDLFSSYSIHRGLREETVSHSIRFEAINPGKFTLQIGDTKLPIIIFSKGKSIRKYVTQVRGHQWEDNVTSTALPYDHTKEIKYAILRVGDKIDVTYNTYIQEIKNPSKSNLKLEINKQN